MSLQNIIHSKHREYKNTPVKNYRRSRSVSYMISSMTERLPIFISYNPGQNILEFERKLYFSASLFSFSPTQNPLTQNNVVVVLQLFHCFFGCLQSTQHCSGGGLDISVQMADDNPKNNLFVNEYYF